MIDSMFHPLDEIRLVGHTWHGLAEGGASSPTVRMTQDGPPFALPFPAPTLTFSGGTHLLKAPGIGPVPLSPEVLEAERAEGRAWQNYGLISGEDLIWNGKALLGWVYIDVAGDRWLIRPYGPNSIRTGTVVEGTPATLQFRVTRFGIVNEPADTPVEIETTLTDIGQAALPGWVLPANSTLRLFINSISSTGDRVVVAVQSIGPIQHSWYPLGYWMLTVTGDGPHFTLSVEVLKTRAEVMPALVTGGSTPPERMFAYEELEEAVPDSSRRKFTIVGSKWTVPIGIQRGLPLGSGQHDMGIVGRIVSMVFDADDVLRVITADLVSVCDYDFPDYTIISTGARYSSGPSDRDTTTSRTCTSTTTLELVVRVDGAERSRTKYTATQSSTWSTHSYYVQAGLGTESTEQASSNRAHRLQAEGDETHEGSMSRTHTRAPDRPYLGESSWLPRRAAFIEDGSRIQAQVRWVQDTDPSDNWPWYELTLGVLRSGNHLACVGTALSIAQTDEHPSSTRNYTPAVVSPRSVWLGDGRTDLYGRLAAYEPYRDEIATGSRDEFRLPCWI